ncbi:hypothetical protein [Nocardia sp. CA-119907]|uniref:hypothetical protein n=1 Tax=Nocardia sp. CA-119907 TaxID=3239973 RepID=UPI003D99774C
MPPFVTRLRDRLATWWHRPGRTRVTLANFAVVVVATTIAGVSALLIEDCLPKPGDSFQFIPTRWALLVVLLGLLGLALMWRNHTQHTSGTLYYTHALAEGMTDLRRAALTEAAENHMAVRTVSRWIDLDDRTTATGIIDIPDTCTDIGATIEELINNDNPDTGYTIAPNLLWPIAFAVGTYLPPAQATQLLELPSGHNPSTSFPLGAAADSTTVTHTTIDLPTTTEPGRVGVWLAFTNAAQYFTVERLAEFGVSTAHTLTGPTGAPTATTPAAALAARQLAALPGAIAEHLDQIKKTAIANNTELVIVAMVPKTVALAIGWELARRELRFFAGTHLIHYDTTTRTYTPMRVHPSQPTTPPAASNR